MGMDSRHLIQHQCDWIEQQLSAMTYRLYHIRERMHQRDFPPDDKLYQLTCDAYNAVLSAHGHAHSLCCRGTMGTTYFFRDKDGIGHETPASERQD